jgi:preprotein translocase subunit YajC
MTNTIPMELVLAQAAPPGGGGIQAFIPLILILVVFYFLLIRPQQKRAKEHQELIKNLKRNDDVVTGGGLHGRVAEVGEDTVVLEIAPKVRVRVDRAQISSLQTTGSRKEG